jgi:hypothetical protein
VRVFENRVLRSIVRVIKSRRKRWARHVARMGRGAYAVLFGRSEGKRSLGIPKRRWEDNIKTDLRKIGIDRANWIRLAQDRARCEHGNEPSGSIKQADGCLTS